MSTLKSDLVAYVRVALWGGELEGIYEKDRKFYALRTVENYPVQLSLIKANATDPQSIFYDTWASSNVNNLQGHVVIENQGVLADHPTGNYFMAFISLDETDSTNLIDLLEPDQSSPTNDLGFQIKKVSLGYIKYNTGAKDKYDYFKEWMFKSKKELDE